MDCCAPAAETVSDNVVLPGPNALVAVIVTELVPATVGVPVMVPVVAPTERPGVVGRNDALTLMNCSTILVGAAGALPRAEELMSASLLDF